MKQPKKNSNSDGGTENMSRKMWYGWGVNSGSDSDGEYWYSDLGHSWYEYMHNT
jgi:hypothetical protein